MDLKTMLLIAALFGTNGLQAIGIVLPARQQATQAQSSAVPLSQQVTDLLIDNERLRKVLMECQERCGP